jgi:hypothetical protein
MSQRVPIDYERDGREVRGLAAWHVLEHFGGQADEDVLEGLKKRLPIALRDFPALAHETMNVGILYENADAKAQAFGYNRLICLPPDEHTTNVTLWHELGHVAIRVRHENDADVAKTSEEFCSIYSVARMPPEVIDEDRIPYLGEPSVPRDEWPEICRRALEYRENNRDYIQQCTDWLDI